MSSRITTTARPGRKRWLFLTAVPLLAAAPAWACTAGQASTIVTPTSGAPGSSISAYTTYGNLTGSYNLRFADAAILAVAGKTCHHDGVIVGGPTKAVSGAVPTTAGTVPSGAARGAADVCFAKTTNDAYNSTPAPSFTVN